MNRFEGRVVVITGGGAGIGRATARRVAAEGGKVALLDLSGEDLTRTAADLEAGGAELIAVRGDMADRSACDEAVERAAARWGRVDALVANAGARAFGSVLNAPDEDWERLVAVNLRGTVHACAAAVRTMRAAGEGGALVLVSSIHAVTGRADMPIYDATKAGILSLARSLAVELAPDRIRVNSVCPGFTVTDFHLRRAAASGQDPDDLRARRSGLLQRPAAPEEVAAAIAFLASEDASYVTATNLMVDAGAHAV